MDRRRLVYIIGAAVLFALVYLVFKHRNTAFIAENAGDKYGFSNKGPRLDGLKYFYSISVKSDNLTINRTDGSYGPPYLFKGPQNARQRAIVDATRHAWSGYVKYAWGRDELKPLSKGWINWLHMGLTIVDSLDTLYIMGLNDEFRMGREWVSVNLTYDKDVDVQMFEVVIRHVGGLLSAYHLSNDQIFLQKATDLGDRLIHCLGGPTGIPCTTINLKRRSPQYTEISTAEAGTIQLEFIDLSRATRDNKYEKRVRVISDKLHSLSGKKDGLMKNFINSLKGKFKPSEMSVGGSADSYYEYLLKQWIQSGRTLDRFRDDYVEAVEGIKKRLVQYTEPNHLPFVGLIQQDQQTFRSEMEHLACFLTGTLALGAMNGLDPSHLDLAANLTRTCYEMYSSMATGLSPEVAGMNRGSGRNKDVYLLSDNKHNAQRPETIESLFYMWKATGDQKYREWGWNIFKSFEKWTRVESGYSGLENVDMLANNQPIRRDKMESFFISETLKYFYLLFDDDNLLPLDRFVFNTEAHPLPILYTTS